jgi:hypothetical protein
MAWVPPPLALGATIIVSRSPLPNPDGLAERFVKVRRAGGDLGEVKGVEGVDIASTGRTGKEKSGWVSAGRTAYVTQ